MRRDRSLLALLIVGLLAAFLPIPTALSMPPRPEILQKLYEEGRLDEVRQTLTSDNRLAASPGYAAGTYGLRAGWAYPDTLRIAVLLVDFSDVPADTILHSRRYFERMLFDSLNPYSMRNYYLANSYGKLDLTGHVYGWFRAKERLAYYADERRGLGNYPKNAERLVEDAINAANPSVDFSWFDNDGPDGIPADGDDDGHVDYLLVVHAGQGYEWTMNPRDIYSHAGTIRPKLVDGVTVEAYATEPEEGKVGTFAHELGHLLGLPDLYDLTLRSYGLGMWSLMAYGSWGGGDGSRPVGLDAWSKARLGFLDPVAVGANVVGVSLPCVEDQPQVLKLWSEGIAGSQYFLVENRRAKSYDSYLSGIGQGLLVYHVDERYSDNSAETGCLVYLEQADGRFDLDKPRLFGFGSDGGDPFPGTMRARTFSWWTTPGNRSNEGIPTEVSLRNIGDSGDVMTLDGEVSSPVLVFDAYMVNDAAGDRDGEPDPGEDVVLRVALRNYGIASSGIRTEISSSDPFVTVLQPVALAPVVAAHAPSGYFDFEVKLDETTPQPHTIEFAIDITATSEAGSYASEDRFVVAVPLSRVAGWPRHVGDVVYSSPALADLDGDGIKEIVLGSYEGLVYAWKVDGTLLPGWPVAVGARTTSKPAVCDVDVDGRPEVVIGVQDGKVHVFRGDGTSLPGWPQATGGPVTSSAVLADIDDDGVVEIVCGSWDGKLYAWNEDGSAVKGWPFDLKGYRVWMSPAAADFDGDNVPEIVVGGWGGELYILKGDGTPMPGWPIKFGYGCGDGSPAIADFDGDGTLEISVSGLWSNSIYVAGVDGKIRRGWPRWASNCDLLSSPVPADIDADGLPEISVSTSCGTIVAWKGDGTPVTQLLHSTGGLVIQYCEPVFVDLDGNGTVEGLVGTADTDPNKLFAFDGSGVIGGFPVPVSGSVWATPSIADLDNDGYDEIVAATTAGDINVWRFVGAKAAGQSEWSQSRGDLWNTGYYGFRPQANMPLADLAVTSGNITFEPVKPKQGEDLTIRVRVANAGHASADGFEVKVCHDGIADSLVISSITVASLAAKRDTVLSFKWRVPGGEPTRLICVSLDPGGRILERFTLNNLAQQRFYLSLADLAVAITGVEPLPAVIGDSLTLRARVTNTGQDVARGFSVAFCDSALAEARRFASLPVDSLLPGEEVDLSVRYAAGEFQEDALLLVCAADVSRNVLEYYLSNNVAEVKVNSGVEGEVLAPSLKIPPARLKFSRTGFAVEPTFCPCVVVTSAQEPYDTLYETIGADVDISRNMVVFRSEGDIAGFDIRARVPLMVSASEAYESEPAVWGENIVWVAQTEESTSLMLKQGAGGVRSIRTSEDGTVANPDISPYLVVWEERHGSSSEIWARDLAADSTFVVSGGDGVRLNPSVYEKTVVWEDRTRDGGDIYAMDTRSGRTTPIAVRGGSQQRPDVYGDMVVWQDSRNGNWDIYGYSIDAGAEFPISRQVDNQTLPAINDSTVMWVDRRGSETRVKGLRMGGSPAVAQVRSFEALSQDARIRVVMNIKEYDDGVTYKLYRFNENRPAPPNPQNSLKEAFALSGDSLHVYEDSLIAERRPYYYALGVIDGYGEESFYGPISGQGYRRAPASFMLGEPFPNPFQYRVTFTLGISRRAAQPLDASWPDPAGDGTPVDVRVYSAEGRLVRTLRAGILLPGFYGISWDGKSEGGAPTSPGVYFIAVSIPGSPFSKKVVLLR